MKLINKGHSVVARAASTDETRYILNGVYLEETEKGMRATATDGRILAMVEDIGEALKAEDFPANVIPKDAENGAKSAIVPTEAYKGAFKALPKVTRFSLPVLQHVAVVMGAKNTTLGVTDLQSPTVKTAANIEGTFPNYKQVIPSGTSKLRISFNPALLMRACQMAEAFGLQGMSMEFTDANSAVKITGSHDGQDLTIVVMPIKYAEAKP